MASYTKIPNALKRLEEANKMLQACCREQELLVLWLRDQLENAHMTIEELRGTLDRALAAVNGTSPA